MAEPQDIADAGSASPSQEPAERASLVSESTMEVDGRSWVVVELPDRESWDLYAGTESDRGSRLAHVRVTDGGYFSTDRTGTVRGPYVTLSEATYPLGLDNPLLLGDVVQPAPAPVPVSGLTAGEPSPSPLQQPVAVDRSWIREALLVSSAIGLALIVQWLFTARRKPRHTSASSRLGRDSQL